MIIWLVIIDDILIFSADSTTIENLCSALKRKFKMDDLGLRNRFLGINISHNCDLKELHLSQEDFMRRIHERFNMLNCNKVSTLTQTDFMNCLSQDTEVLENVPYRERLRCLLYVTICTRPNIIFSVHLLSQFHNFPTKTSWEGLSVSFHYLKGTQNVGVSYQNCGKNDELVMYADADFGADQLDRKSVSSHLFNVNNNLISWSIQKQSVVALSSTEAEYILLSSASCTRILIKFKYILTELGIKVNQFKLFKDNQSTILLSKEC